MRSLLLTILIDVVFAVGIYFAYVENVIGAYNVVALWVWAMFIMSAIFLLGSCRKDVKNKKDVKFGKTKTTWAIISTIAESIAFAWFGSFVLASINLLGLLFVQAGKVDIDSDDEPTD